MSDQGRPRRAVEMLLRHRGPAGVVLAACSLAAIMLATLLPSGQTLSSTRWCIVCGSLGGVDIVLNVALFVPFAAGLAMAGVRPFRVVATCVLLTLTIETLQFVMIPGRDASVGDVLANSLGGALGCWIGVSLDAWITPDPRGASRLMWSWLGLWLMVHGIAGYSLTPEPTDLRYYGQIKPMLSGRPPYAGDVTLARIDGQPIPTTSYDRAGIPHPELAKREGAIVRVDIVPRGRTPRLVPIVRIADGSFEEIMLVGQHRTDLVFGIRNGAVTLHLRPLYFALRDVFPRSDSGGRRDTVKFEARYSARHVDLRADIGEVRHEVRIPTSPSIGWRLLLPLRAYADGDRREDIFAIVWMLMLLSPVGYWLALASRRSGERRATMRNQAGVAAVVVLGFVVVPVAFGLALPGPLEWGGAAAALGTGWAIARLVIRR